MAVPPAGVTPDGPVSRTGDPAGAGWAGRDWIGRQPGRAPGRAGQDEGMRLDVAEARRRFASVPVARLATVSPGGRPHLVPFTFALDSDAGEADSGPEDCIYSAVDAKPKSSTDLRRLRNIRANPRVAVLADHYEDDWDGLWWVRADGQAAILDDPAAMAPALALLGGRYPQYRGHPPAGPVISVRVTRWTGWAARPA
jgi:PPOX class probable F420-dependent enzyme